MQANFCAWTQSSFKWWWFTWAEASNTYRSYFRTKIKTRKHILQSKIYSRCILVQNKSKLKIWKPIVSPERVCVCVCVCVRACVCACVRACACVGVPSEPTTITYTSRDMGCQWPRLFFFVFGCVCECIGEILIPLNYDYSTSNKMKCKSSQNIPARWQSDAFLPACFEFNFLVNLLYLGRIDWKFR